MPINTNLLIAAPMLQDAFVDKDGSPMANGKITCYHDNSRTTLKNWYYQISAGGSYVYITLPNPLRLSAAGTICDVNGADVIPFFYPYDETDPSVADPYYITIVNQSQTNQITRENFPFIASNGGGGGNAVNSFNNLVINNGFWRNIEPNTVNVTPFNSVALNAKLAVPPGGTLLSAVVAPSQHDSFRMPDIQFQKNNTSATDLVTFTPFPLGNAQPVDNNIVPEYYINHVCNAPGVGETTKFYQFPISAHVNTLSNVQFTGSIQAQNAGGTSAGENVLSVRILQDTGTGGTPIASAEIKLLSLNPGWELYQFTGTFPDTTGLNLGLGADDALYLQIQLPLNVPCNINFTKPSIYLTQNVLPTNDFQTYDQVDSVINTPRTGDVRTSLNNFAPFGWVVANDGEIGSRASGASSRANADTWPLYNLLWNNVSAANAPVTGAPGGRGTTAYSDFSLNRPITLTKMFDRVIAGTINNPGTLGAPSGADTANVPILPNNLPAHAHPTFTPGGFFVEKVAIGGTGFSLSTPNVYSITSPTTGNNVTANTPLSVTVKQKTVNYNVFFKL